MKRQTDKRKKTKSERIVSVIVFIGLSLLMIFAWNNEEKNINFNELIEINDKLVSYEYKIPGDRGTGYETKVLFLKINNYKTEFRTHVDYDLFKNKISESENNNIKIFIEPKYEKFLQKVNSDVETIGLYINNVMITSPNEDLKGRNLGVKYGIPIFIVVLLCLAGNEIWKLRKLRK